MFFLFFLFFFSQKGRWYVKNLLDDIVLIYEPNDQKHIIAMDIPFFQFTTRLDCHILASQTTWEPVAAKLWQTYHIPHTIITKFWQKNRNNNTLDELPCYNDY